MNAAFHSGLKSEKVHFLEKLHCFPQRQKSTFFKEKKIKEWGSLEGAYGVKKKFQKTLILAIEIAVQPHIIYCTIFPF